MTDRVRLDEMLASLHRYVAELQRLSLTEKATFLANSEMVGNPKYHSIIAIECCVDIANHVIASERSRAPTDYADTFRSLVEAQVLDEGTGEALVQAARFRNRLTHRYWAVDDGLVHQFLEEDLHHFSSFAEQTGKSCDESP